MKNAEGRIKNAGRSGDACALAWEDRAQAVRSGPFQPAALRRCFRLSKNQENQPAQLPARAVQRQTFSCIGTHSFLIVIIYTVFTGNDKENVLVASAGGQFDWQRCRGLLLNVCEA